MCTISACLIVKDEESCIKDCLDSISPLCDEIIIYDTGSTDKTKEIVKTNPLVKLIEGEWKDDFSWARNQSFKYATKDYILWVDADDLIDKPSMDFLLNFKRTSLNLYDGVEMPYRYHFDGKKDEYTLNRTRIIKRNLNLKWVGRIHEYLPFNGNGITLSNNNAYIIHNHQKPYGDRNLKIFQDMDKNGEIKSIRDEFYYANELYDHHLFDDAIKWYVKCTSKKEMWNIDRLNAYLKLYKIYRLFKNDINEAFKYALLAVSCTNTPRADVCCALGDIYTQMNNIEWAIYWYEKAYNNVATGLDSTFLSSESYTMTPLLMLCVLYFQNGNIEKSYEMNKLAEKINPKHPSVIYNNNFFKNMNFEK